MTKLLVTIWVNENTMYISYFSELSLFCVYSGVNNCTHHFKNKKTNNL